MRVAIVSKADASGGGASRCAQDLTAYLHQRGIRAVHFCSTTRSGWSPTRRPLGGPFNRLLCRLHYVGKRIGLPDVIPFELPALAGRLRDFDLFHFHDLLSAVSPLTLAVISRWRPVVWTLHDCSPFTGGCLYPYTCHKYRRRCTQCPQLGAPPLDNPFAFTGLIQSAKKLVHDRRRIVCIAPSRWMADQARSARIVSTRPQIIRNGADLKHFRPLDKQQVRKSLGLPRNRRIILLTAGALCDPRKGNRIAVDTIRSARALNPFVVLLGRACPDLIADLKRNGIQHRAFGYEDNPARLNQIYACADCFLLCSLADNQPLSVLESLASGTPVLGFATGGIPETIRQNQTGFLVPPSHRTGLVEALTRAFCQERLRAWSLAARRDAEQRFSRDQWGESHVRLYRQILAPPGQLPLAPSIM